MVTYLVQIEVINEYIQEFINETKNNVLNSRKEDGVVAFNFYQQTDTENHFVLIETYKSTEDQLLHRETIHYQTWRNNVEKMMASPRKGIKLNSIMNEK
jgi:(4S)-4-hydroxy-5-phosphonooxypentane-2,3-dione isomerase